MVPLVDTVVPEQPSVLEVQDEFWDVRGGWCCSLQTLPSGVFKRGRDERLSNYLVKKHCYQRASWLTLAGPSSLTFCQTAWAKWKWKPWCRMAGNANRKAWMRASSKSVRLISLAARVRLYQKVRQNFVGTCRHARDILLGWLLYSYLSHLLFILCFMQK